jgi:hypothetical protein
MLAGNPSGPPRRNATALVAAVVFIVSVMSIASSERGHSATLKPIRWLFNGPGVAAMAQDSEASRLLDGAQPFVMWGRPLQGVPQSWNAVPVISLKSSAEVQNALETGALGPEIKGVMYDYEKWRFTPEDEQRNPDAYLKRAADLVHSKGLLFLTAPAVNLVTVMAPGTGGARLAETYLKLEIAANAARYADVFDIQAQRFEHDAGLYASFVRQAAAQARQANPKVLVLAGVSTEPIGRSVSADDILRAIAATRDVVDGYWFNIPQPSEYSPAAKAFRPEIAVEVLRRLAGS